MDKSNAPAIVVKELYKSFRLPYDQHSGIKQLLINIFRRKRIKGYETQKVLNDISFEIKQGEFFGIVGRNGSGKSTLLKLLAGIYAPDTGLIQVNGSLTPFIELGVGFNPELTGRENIFLNGALLGFSKSEMEEMYEDIVNFAELAKFMDQKLKNYSSGMQVRLAFSIAIRAESNILLLDEVLAVGDEAFQRKCFDYFETLKRNKQTVVLVTHDMQSVERFCTRALLITDGVIQMIGKPHDIAAAYSRINDDDYSLKEKKSSEPSIIDIKTYNDNDKENNKFVTGETMTVKALWKNKDIKQVGIAIYRLNGEYIFGTNTYIDNYSLENSSSIEYKIDLNLSEGTYFIQAGLFNEDATKTIEFESDGPRFIVNRDKEDSRWGGITKLNHSWNKVKTK